ncbi:GNAT family N-acetyltransferase [Sphingomonas sp.]|uniref:GNAT family N-acetyltransferase n=1 Tax=Sphingomonas sp. TaxID=28214 RepID=UPI0031DA7A8D
MGKPTPTEVREATPADKPRVVATLTRAFDQDPIFDWVFPDPAVRARRGPRVFDMFFDANAAPNMRLVTGDCSAATLWHAPNAPEGGLRELWRVWRAAGSAFFRFKRIGDSVEAHFPPQPFWYLHIAGADPARQGEGLGAAVVQAGLDRIGNATAYLETGKQANIGFYEKLGFRVRDEWDVPGGGPHFWSMIRPQD